MNNHKFETFFLFLEKKLDPFVNIHNHSNSSNDQVIEIKNYLIGKEVMKPFGLFTAGLHPWYIHLIPFEKFANEMDELIMERKLVGLGETGLDKLTEMPMQEQERVFLFHVYLAEKIKKPLIIHCVRSYAEILNIHQKINPKQVWIIHGFNRNEKIAKELINRNIKLSFGKDLLNNQVVQTVFKSVPLESVFFETDDADSCIEEIYRKAAELRQMKLNDLKRMIYRNFNLIFNMNGVA